MIINWVISSEVKTFENHFFYEKRLIEIKYLVFKIWFSFLWYFVDIIIYLCWNKEYYAEVEHYYYKEWPDKSFPPETQSILALIDTINAVYSADESEINPILVHCSAGIGRTGSFIAIFNLIEMMAKNKRIYPKKLITEMRKQRAFLVQNWVSK